MIAFIPVAIRFWVEAIESDVIDNRNEKLLNVETKRSFFILFCFQATFFFHFAGNGKENERKIYEIYVSFR